MASSSKSQKKKISKKSINKNILLSTSFISLLVIILIGTSFYYVTKNQLIKSYDQLLYNKALDSAKLVDEQIKNHLIAIETLGNLNLITDNEVDMEEKLDLLKKEKDRLNFSYIGIADIQGNLILDNGQSLDIYEEEYFFATKDGGSYISEPIINPLTGQVALVASAPIISNEEFSGVLVAFISANNLYNISSSIQFGESGHAFIMDHRADVIAHPTIRSGTTTREEAKNFRTLEKLVDPEYSQNITQIYDLIRTKEAGTGVYAKEGKIVRIGFAPIESKDWTLVVSIDEGEILAPLNRLLNTFLILVALAGIIGFLSSSFFIRKLTRQIGKLTEYSYKISEMDFRENIDKNILSREDELGIIGNSLQRITDKMREMVYSLGQSAEEVLASSQELAAISEETTASANNIHEASHKIYESSKSQHNAISNAVVSIHKISVQMDNVADKTKDANSLSIEILNKAQLGKEKINQSMTQIQNIKNSTLTVKKSLDEINKSSQKMNEMLSIIENISEETNLLALNATIEAARAGEYGRGFAVVANEIKNLAEETQNSAKEIKAIIANNNILIEEANEKMDSNTIEVEQGVVTVDEAKTSFDEIAKLIENITRRIEDVLESTLAVESNIDNLVKSSNIIEEMSHNISAEITHSSQATEEQLGAMEEIASSAENLASLAEKVRSMLDSIKIEKN